MPQVTVMDNAALAARCAAAGEPRPLMGTLNALAGGVFACASAPTRLGGAPRGGVAALAADVAPYPRLHFALPTLAPLVAPAAAAYESLSVRDVVGAALAPEHALVSARADELGAATLATALLWRGSGGGADGAGRGVSAADVAAALAAAAASASATRAVDWAPSGGAVYMTPAPMPALPVRRHAHARTHPLTRLASQSHRTLPCFALSRTAPRVSAAATPLLLLSLPRAAHSPRCRAARWRW
jgi:hypothetical protein